MEPKVVRQHNNPDNPKRCFVELFRCCQSKCPQDRPKYAFYLQPLKNSTPNCWFSSKPIGHNKLEGTVTRLCKDAGIPRFSTNHSLRVTAATRLYQTRVDEQQVIECTGHCSLEGKRSYKRTSDVQKQAVSDILNHRETQKVHSAVVPRSNMTIATDPNSLLKANPLSQVTNTSQSQAMNFVTTNFQLYITINVDR